MVGLLFLSGCGFLLSLYIYIIERKLKRDPSYMPACNLGDVVSCTKPIASEYGRLFFVSNAVIGMVYYALFFIGSLFQLHHVLFVTSIGALLASCVLAWVLYIRIKAVCIVCTAIYVVNVLLLIMSYYNL